LEVKKYPVKQPTNYALALMNNSEKRKKKDAAYFVDGPQEIDPLGHF